MFSEDLRQELLQPINDESFCGYYIKGDKAAFRQLRNAFNLAQTSLRKLSQNPDGNELDVLQEENAENWSALANELLQVFRKSSRDIELIGWFLASQLFMDSTVASFTKSLEWFAELLDTNWGVLNPVLPIEKLKGDSIEEHTAEQAKAKAKAFFQLLGDSEESCLLYAPVLMLPLIGDISFYQYQSAERRGEIGLIKQNAAQLLGAERTTVQRKLNNLQRAIVEIDRMSLVCDKHCQSAGVLSPNFNFVKTLLGKFDKAIQYLTGLKPAMENAVNTESSTETELKNEVSKDELSSEKLTTETQAIQQEQQIMMTQSQNMSQTAAMNSINRNVALHQLREISDYFRQSEPHSPVSFLIEKAIRWGGMSLPDLLKEMLEEPEGGLLNKIFNTAGLDQSDQVLLPEISNQSSGVKAASKVANVAATIGSKPVEASVSDVPRADTQINQNPKNGSPAKSTALSW
ncbi:type VI secretion protein [Parashewanella spongiae]|uniref:Type VI secretion protein n=1 Tax=Parashewanella spongiae TaxID=342950 RepID=A0A3A6UCB3_9GAMM|nr:type VI secretion system ImpA family N-terminal domain-containing protein [Parashewanella spongiae]MCL1078180.1 type VI secretion system ImpA family N-terminal domain-containing protein [Parashewanella spongiae]RJY14885.1 type VI secretion protein [Parashewanella spongiae]